MNGLIVNFVMEKRNFHNGVNLKMEMMRIFSNREKEI